MVDKIKPIIKIDYGNKIGGDATGLYILDSTGVSRIYTGDEAEALIELLTLDLDSPEVLKAVAKGVAKYHRTMPYSTNDNPHGIFKWEDYIDEAKAAIEAIKQIKRAHYS